MSNHNSPEYLTIIRCTPALVTALRDDLVPLSGELLAADLIDDDIAAALNYDFMSKEHRVAQLMEFVRNRVSQDPKRYHSFIEVLKQRQDDHRNILEFLDKKYKEHIEPVEEGWLLPTATPISHILWPMSTLSVTKSISESTPDYVKKVDKGHYFEFEMPKGCASLSDLIHQMMPNYDPASGYLYRQYVTGESVQPDEKILLFDKDGSWFDGYEAHQLMTVGQEIKLDGTKWKRVFVQCKSKSSVLCGSSFLYYNPHLACSSDSLSEEESSKLISHYYYLLSTPNIVSLSYEENDYGTDVLSVGVIDINDSTITLPRRIIYETSEKWVTVPVQMFHEGVIKALSGPCEGGCAISTDGLDCGGTLGVNIEYRGHYRLLSTAHVLTMHDDSNKGKTVYMCIEDDTDPIVYSNGDKKDKKKINKKPIAVIKDHIRVRVYNKKEVDNPERFTQDLAWAEFLNEQGFPTVRGIGNVQGIRPPQQREYVKYYGAASLAVQDKIKIISTNAAMVMKVDGCGWVFYENIIKLNTFGSTLEKGDSGSALVAESDTKVVGMLMGKHVDEQAPKQELDRAYACKL